jgi:hypothetical protein
MNGLFNQQFGLSLRLEVLIIQARLAFRPPFQACLGRRPREAATRVALYAPQRGVAYILTQGHSAKQIQF